MHSTRGVDFNKEKCKLCEFLGFLCCGHVSYQIWSWLPEILREPKIWRLEAIHNYHFVVKGHPPLIKLIYVS